ncbi:MAG: hypothetical protein L0Y54_10495, partial [Sporichthyaceae bacterium]|nr:hypothetical protein [Sporichthyaceae bacterium]
MATTTRSSAAPAAVGPARLSVARRERHPAAVAFGVLLVLVGAMIGVLVWQQTGDRLSVIQVINRVPAGQQITVEDVRAVTVSPNNDIAYVPWTQRDQLGGYYTLTALLPGTVLTGGMLTTDAPPSDGQVVIGLALSAGQYPPNLQVGDRVNALRAPRSGDPAGLQGLAAGAVIDSIAATADEDGLA